MNLANLQRGRREQFGAFARIFERANAVELAGAFSNYGLTTAQLNLSALGLPTIPEGEQLRELDLAGLHVAFAARDVDIWGISATFNTAHPDSIRRRDETRAAARFISRLDPTGATAATLCSGSRDATDMWAFHPDTASEDAWHDFRETLDLLLPAAEDSGVLLAVEPEPANTVADVDRAHRLVKELGDDISQVGFILDPANLVAAHDRRDHEAVLRRAFGELGEWAICVHAKDTVPWADTIRGEGIVDYDLVAELHGELPRAVPVIIQDASEAELADVISIVRSGSRSATKGS